MLNLWMKCCQTISLNTCFVFQQMIHIMNFEESQQGHMACPPTKVNEWVEQQLAAIKAEASRPDQDLETQEV